MQNHFPLWKNGLILIILVVASIYALPNLYGDDPSVQVSSSSTPLEQSQVKQIEDHVKQAGLNSKSVEYKNGQALVRFENTNDQLKAADILRDKLGNNVTVALNLAPATPAWLNAFGAKPMYLGLDLRGGVHFLLEVDMEAAIKQAQERYTDDVRTALRTAKVHYVSVGRDKDRIKVQLKSAEEVEAATQAIDKDLSSLKFESVENLNELILTIPEVEQWEIKKFALTQNITTLRNRVNELGVAEPVIQQ
ncbi:MAG: protein translocase subunit SecD, partial [Methylicorpusculum sp.]|nr:protein translocase subunit SecD [Methylicorpusculum sp.]